MVIFYTGFLTVVFFIVMEILIFYGIVSIGLIDSLIFKLFFYCITIVSEGAIIFGGVKLSCVLSVGGWEGLKIGIVVLIDVEFFTVVLLVILKVFITLPVVDTITLGGGAGLGFEPCNIYF